MGFGLPAAAGAAVAMGERPRNQRRPVVLVDGDGAFQMNIQELAILFAEKLPVKIVIVNNQCLGMVSQWEERFFRGVHANTDLHVPQAGRPYPDFRTIAAGYMVPGEEVGRLEDLEGALKRMLAARGPYLLDVHVDSETQVLPMIPAGKTCEDIIEETP
jgi:acetolactate synthase-1/2/3 large subunit